MKIKKCPFCRAKADIEKDILHFYMVRCQNCGCRTRGTQTQEEAVNIWNRRCGDKYEEKQ